MAYRVYGRRLASVVRLPEVRTCDGPADLSFSVAPLGPAPDGPWFDIWSTEQGRPWVRALRTEYGYRIRYERRADFLIDRRSATVVCDPRDCPEMMMRHFLLDQVLPLMLSLDAIVLHASSVAVNGGFAAFIGPGGAGKSTIALALGRAGYAIGSDDGLLVRSDDQVVTATPAYPTVRVWQDSASKVAALPPANATAPSTAKRRFRDGFRFATDELPLTRVYALDPHPSATIRFEPLAPRVAVMALIEQSYRLSLDDSASLARQLDELVAIARHVPAWRLSTPRRLDAWRDFADAIATHSGGGAFEVA